MINNLLLRTLGYIVGFSVSILSSTIKELPPFIKEGTSYQSALDCYPLIAITCHYNPERLECLEKVLQTLKTFPKADIVLLTNTGRKRKTKEIEECYKKVFPAGIESKTVSMRTCPDLMHPIELTWSHKQLIKDEFLDPQKGYTHFIYLEDDIALDFDNFCYFVHARDVLKEKRLIPSFLRVETNNRNQIVSSSSAYKIAVNKHPQAPYRHLLFLNLNDPFCACYILDKELAEEYSNSPSFDLKNSSKVCSWGIRMRAGMGLCFENIPSPFYHRFVIPLDVDRLTCPFYAQVSHIPSSLARTSSNLDHKIPVDSLFYFTQKGEK
ncbi:hypothetical protein EB008_03475 [bacterium]|nr:hypothetical protein [bacterium]